MPHHHCCVIGCKSDSRYNFPDQNGTLLKFFGIPNVITRKDVHNKWLEVIRRPSLNVSRNTRICSRHFVDGRPTVEHPFPTENLEPSSERDICLNTTNVAHPTKFGQSSTKSEKPRDHVSNEGYENFIDSASLKKPKLDNNFETNTFQSLYAEFKTDDDIYFTQPVLCEYKSTQTDSITRQTQCKSIQTVNAHSIEFESRSEVCSSLKDTQSVFSPFVQVKFPVPCNVTFLKDDRHQFHFYTGFETYAEFQDFMEKISPRFDIFDFHSDFGEQNGHELSENRSTNLVKELSTLSLENALLLVLMVKNLSLQFQDVANRFQVSVSTVQYLVEKSKLFLNKHLA
ncbi:uncharacterized protein LOC143239740 [Tachypleus tridentatus]|uniref:uncharacterized protein LOC143239740 n=1 Tax=Tachypleus tridentatus TaxID=6853 RepID=UPI003FD1B414